MSQSARESSACLVQLTNVVKSFKTAAGAYTALHGVDLQIMPGEFVAIVGKSGSGKSTLMNMITGIDRPTSGSVLVGGTAVHTLSEDQAAQWRGQTLGIVFQFFQLLPALSLYENVLLPMDFVRVLPKAARAKRAADLLARMGLADHSHKLPTAVSGGQQQRAAIARALANDPLLIVADEPTGNLDSHTADQVFQLFTELAAAGKTIVMVTHDRDLARRAGRTITLADGRIEAQPEVRIAV